MRVVDFLMVCLEMNGELRAFLLDGDVDAQGTGVEGGDERRAELQTEIRMLQKLRHPNVVGYIGVQREGNAMNIFQQYVAGGSVATLLMQFGAFSEDVTAVYTKQTTEGLAFLHENHVVHRDIKGGNVLVDIDGTVKLADFGSAATLSDIALKKDMHGTPFWMAPEVIQGQDMGEQADIWSLGCTVMEMLTAKRPFAHTSMSFVQLCNALLSSEAPAGLLPPGFSAPVSAFLELCLARDPQARPKAEELLQHSFLAAVEPAQGMEDLQEVLRWHNEWVAFLLDNAHIANDFEEWSFRNSRPVQDEPLQPKDVGAAERIQSDFGPLVDSPSRGPSESDPHSGPNLEVLSPSHRTLSLSQSPRHRPFLCADSCQSIAFTPPQRTLSSGADAISLGPADDAVLRRATLVVTTPIQQYLKTKHTEAVQSVNVPLQSAIKIQRAWARHKAQKARRAMALEAMVDAPLLSPDAPAAGRRKFVVPPEAIQKYLHSLGGAPQPGP